MLGEFTILPSLFVDKNEDLYAWFRLGQTSFLNKAGGGGVWSLSKQEKASENNLHIYEEQPNRQS